MKISSLKGILNNSPENAKLTLLMLGLFGALECWGLKHL